VILVDDGLATGASMMAAIQALREADPAEIVIAVPAGAGSGERLTGFYGLDLYSLHRASITRPLMTARPMASQRLSAPGCRASAKPSPLFRRGWMWRASRFFDERNAPLWCTR